MCSICALSCFFFFFFQAEDGIRDLTVTGVQTCALPISRDPGIRTVLFTDVVNSTTLTQSLGDEAALAILGVHDVIVRDALSALGGREVKHTGDGIMASFVSAAGAVRCAIQVQRELARHAQANPDR